MILKASSRANGSDLATHLMNGYDNEQVELAEMRGTVADDLHGAFAEIELIASGTRAQKPLFSLSVNPHEPLTREQYFEAIDAIENKLGLTDQPRAVVFHVKEGREHAHIVWSRIDGMEMKAISDSFFKSKLCDMAVVLAEKFGHELPEGLKAWKENYRQFCDKLEPTLAETANAKKTGITPEQRRSEITTAYEQADSATAFVNALEEKGYVLAKGDSRAFVVVDRFSDVHSLSRYVKDVSAKEIKKRLAGIDTDSLPGVKQAQDQAKARMAALEDKLREERAREQERGVDERAAKHEAASERSGDGDVDLAERKLRSIDEKRAAMDARQSQRRLELRQAEQEVLTRHQDEKLALDAAQKAESGGLLFRIRAKVADLIEDRPALRSVLGHITEKAGLDPRERHRLEQQALARRHARERVALAARKRANEKIDQRERASLERDLKREALRRMLRQEQLRAAARVEQTLARDAGTELPTNPRLLEDQALSEEFNAEAQVEAEADAGEGEAEDGRKPRKGWGARAKGKGQNHERGKGRGRGMGYGYRRGGD